MTLMILCRQKCIQILISASSSLEVEIATEYLRSCKIQVLFKFRQKRSKQEVIYYVLRSTNFLILFGIRNNYQGR